MLPNESLRKAAGVPAQPRPVINNLMASVERTPAASEMHSVLARPHSRHLVTSKSTRGPAHDARNASFGNTGTGRSASPPRLKHECAPLPATPPPTRSRSPQQTVRTLGNAIVNPQTVFTSAVERSTQIHSIRAASPSSPQRSTRSLPTSPFNKGSDNNRLRSAIALSDSAASQQGALVTTTRAGEQVEVYGMEALRRGYGTTADALSRCGDQGSHMEDLLPMVLPAPDLKKLDLRVVVPHYGLQAAVVPKIRLLGDPEIIIEVPHNAETQRAVATECHLSRFVAHSISVEETGLDRALHYHVHVDVPEMFTEAPSIDAATGDMTFVPNPLASGTSKCAVQLFDSAMVDAEGSVMRSESIPFAIVVQRSNAKGNGLLDGTATMGAHSTTMGNTTIASSTSANARVCLATQGDFAVTQSPQDLLRLRSSDNTSSATAADSDATAQPYVFPPANPHELRYTEVTHINNLWIAQNPTSNNINGDAVKPALYRPCFDSVLTDVEMVRLGRAAQERDRIIGERVDEVRRVELEGKLIDRIRQEEKRIGADSVELCPLLLRLAQVYMPQGSKRQGDVVELLERISRIRLRTLGVDNFDQIDALAAQLGGSVGLNGSMASAGGATLNSSTTGGMLGGMGVLNGSIFAQAQAATASLDASTTPSSSDDAAATQTKESKKFDAFHQSLLLLTLYLKTVGRYREMLDFANYAVTAASIVQGDGSVAYLRAMTEVAEGHLLIGNYKEAGPLLAGCVARAEVLFGGDAHATHNLIHMYGTCCAEERDYSKSMSAHDRVLRSRLKHGDPADQLALAESYLLCAWARVQSGSNAATLMERMVEYHEAAVAILVTIDKSALPPAMSVGRAGLMALAARIARMRGDNERAHQLLLGVSDDVASSRGFDSLEAAVLSTALAAQRLSQHCEGWSAKRVQGGTAKEKKDAKELSSSDDEVTSSIAALQLANSVLLTILGAQHPYTVRCATLLAETRMYANAQQSAQVVERCLVTVRKLLHPHHRDQVILHHVSSVVHLMTRDNTSALMEATTAHAVAVELNAHDDMMVELETTLLGALCRNHEPPSGALIALLESRVKSFTMQHGETSDLLVTPLQNLAEAFYLLGDFPRAHHYLSRALKIADAVNFIFLLGHLLKPVAQLTVADVQERNRIARDRIHTQLSLKFSEILFQIAAVFDAEGKADDAQSTYLQSLAAQEISGVVAGLSVVEILSALAALLYAEGHFGDALAYAEKGHAILLENFPTMRCVLDAVCDILRVVLFRLRCNGYTLLRHPDSRHRFTTYV